MINHAAGLSFIMIAITSVLSYRFVATKYTDMRGALLCVFNILFIYLFSLNYIVVAYYLVFCILNVSALYLVRLFGKFTNAICRTFILLIILNLISVKYFQNYLSQFDTGLDTNLPLLGLIGLSYCTFRSLDFIIELGRGRVSAETKTTNVLAYLLFFPAFVQGPISRSIQFSKEIGNKIAPFKWNEFDTDLIRLLSGIIKILFFSKILFLFTPLNDARMELITTDRWMLLLSLYAFYLYIYVEFSGICDIAIILSKWMGFSIPENFNFPIIAVNIQDFWNRWHMSLSFWCRDHIFFNIVKQLTRKIPQLDKVIASLLPVMITFIFIGMWHGNTVYWLLYGLVHGFGVYAVTFYNLKIKNRSKALTSFMESKVGFICGVFLTFNFVSISLICALPESKILLIFP